MKGKRIVALVLSGCMTFGQTVWAEGTVKEESQKATVNQTETSNQTKPEEQSTETASMGEENSENKTSVQDNDTKENTEQNAENNEAAAQSKELQSQDNNGIETESVDDIIEFKDENLKRAIISSNSEIDANSDGEISKEEIKSLHDLYCSYYGVKNLDGLEYATNLVNVYFNGNAELSDVHVLSELDNLKYIDLRETNVSTDDKWKLAKINDEMQIAYADRVKWITNGEIFDEDEVKFEKTGGEDVISINGRYMLGTKVGTSTVKVTAGNHSKEIQIEVKGVPAEQYTGEDSDSTVNDYVDSTILTSNGELWTVYPEKKKVAKNVKRYVSGYVYLGDEGIPYTYRLQDDDSLWADDKQLAENVEKFSGLYVLDKKGNLINICNTEMPVLTSVTAWAEYTDSQYIETDEGGYWTDDYWVYYLKENGTLWRRMENGEKITDPEKVADGIKELSNRGYLSKAGKYISFDGEDEFTGVASIPVTDGYSTAYYIGTDGHTHFKVYDDWYDLGQINIVKTERMMVDTTTHEYDSYYITDKNELYRVNNGTPELIADHVQDIKNYNDGLYQGTDGLWRRLSDHTCGTVENPIQIGGAGWYTNIWTLEDYGVANDYNVKKNDMLILNHVKKLIMLGDMDDEKVYAIRTDGTLWNIQGVPEQVMDLNVQKLLKGDVDGDGEVNIQDLRTILRAVCEKEELNADQLTCADVNEDGKLDIQDLRKVLRFVCGKESTL